MINPWIEFLEGETMLVNKALVDIRLIIAEAIRSKGFCRIGLAGGKTPKALYAKLAEEKIAWDKIQIVQLDERYVPSDDPESNLAVLRKTLFKVAPIPPQNIFVFDTSLPYESAAEEMNRKLKAVPSRTHFFDLLILGAGADGHIASLFEGDTALLETENWAACATAKGYPSEKRLTLTLPILKSTQAALLLLKGKSKAALIAALEAKAAQPPLTALKALLAATQVKVFADLQNE